ncbi:alpha/beta hydrolase [Shewanella sp. OPT22]|nr:alpha/beta hydrolase [Shewanella sp. OPT22]
MIKAEKPFMMLHGSISNGKVFYSESGKGFACFLAKHGFTSYIIDMPGRGLSEPKLSRGVNPSQTEVIVDVIPQIQQFILSQHPDTKKVSWVGHSWGGVLMSAALLRFPDLQKQVKTLVGFGTKRLLRAKSLKKIWMIDIFWKHIALFLIRKQGYLAADRYGIGMDNESELSIKNQIPWLSKDWVDPMDGFDYQAQISVANLPSCWFFAGQNDPVLGHPNDVKNSLDELSVNDSKFTLLGKKQGNKQDYDHVGMLAHPDCVNDHFKELLDWYQN